MTRQDDNNPLSGPEKDFGFESQPFRDYMRIRKSSSVSGEEYLSFFDDLHEHPEPVARFAAGAAVVEFVLKDEVPPSSVSQGVTLAARTWESADRQVQNYLHSPHTTEQVQKKYRELGWKIAFASAHLPAVLALRATSLEEQQSHLRTTHEQVIDLASRLVAEGMSSKDTPNNKPEDAAVRRAMGKTLLSLLLYRHNDPTIIPLASTLRRTYPRLHRITSDILAVDLSVPNLAHPFKAEVGNNPSQPYFGTARLNVTDKAVLPFLKHLRREYYDHEDPYPERYQRNTTKTAATSEWLARRIKDYRKRFIERHQV